jgi:hypothetical protein
MKKQIALLVVVATFACCSITRASITAAAWNTDNPLNLTCTYLYPFAGSTLDMDGVQHAGLARMMGTIQTDTVLDPTLHLSSAVNNDTGFVWNGYRVNVFMSVPFAFVPPAPTVNNPPISDWFLAGQIGPSLVGPSQYEGSLFFSAGTPVGIGGELDFNYAIQFASSLDYSFTQEMIPSLVPIPEPGTFILAGMGALVLALRCRRNRA